MSESRLLDRFLKSAGQLKRFWNPKTLEFEAERTPTVLKAGSAKTNTFTAWTPTSGKRIRIMGYSFQLTKEAACAGAFRVTINTEGENIIHDFSAAALVATGNFYQIIMNFPANGLLQLQDVALTCTFSGALTAGSLSYQFWGTEE